MKKELRNGIIDKKVKSYCPYCGYTTYTYVGNDFPNEKIDMHCERCYRHFTRFVNAKQDYTR